MVDDTDVTRRRWGLFVVGVLLAAVIAAVIVGVIDGSPDVGGAVARELSAEPVEEVEPLVDEPFAGADPARLPADVDQRWSTELSDLVATDRTRLYVDGSQTVLALLDRSAPIDAGVVVALDANTGAERWRAGFDRGSGSLRILGILEGVAMIERLHPDDRAIVGIDVDTGSELWDRPVTEPGLNRVLDGTSLVTRIGVSNEAGLNFIDPTSGDEVGRVDGELFSTDLLGRWYVRDGASIVELDLRAGWSPPTSLGRLADPDVDVVAVVGGRVVEADGITLTVSDADGGESTVEVQLRELGPVASIRSLYPMAGSTFVIGTETASYGAVLGADGVELRWEVDGHVVNTSATDRGLTLLTAAAGGTDLRVIDASTGTTITPLSLEPGSIDALRLVANGVVVERPAVIGAERVGLDLDGEPMWSLIGSGPVAIGDELITDVAPTADGVRIIGYGSGSADVGE